MSTSRFHKAAKDGIIDKLKEATKGDCNARDELGMTPTLYAAFYGHLEALRLLCGRGGNPDKADSFGNTALHLAATQGHKHIVTFLINFGANVYAVDVDNHTPQELAGINNRDDILRLLDSAVGKLETSDKKKAKSLKEKAKKDAEKRNKEFSKLQAKQEMTQKIQKRQNKPSLFHTIKFGRKSESMKDLSQIGQKPFSVLVNGSISKNMNSTVQRRVASRNKQNINDDFKMTTIEDGQRSVRVIQGIRKDSEVIYSGAIMDAATNKRGRLDNVVFAEEDIGDHQANNTMTTTTASNLYRTQSQPDFMQEFADGGLHNTASIFSRPIGSVSIMKPLNTFKSAVSESPADKLSLGSAFDEFSISESSEDEHTSSAIERFLTAWKLDEYLSLFEEQKIDLEALMMLTESDLKELNLPLGHYRKLVNAINERKRALENPGEVVDGNL